MVRISTQQRSVQRLVVNAQMIRACCVLKRCRALNPTPPLRCFCCCLYSGELQEVTNVAPTSQAYAGNGEHVADGDLNALDSIIGELDTLNVEIAKK